MRKFELMTHFFQNLHSNIHTYFTHYLFDMGVIVHTDDSANMQPTLHENLATHQFDKPPSPGWRLVALVSGKVCKTYKFQILYQITATPKSRYTSSQHVDQSCL
jgi:hypothetical protein